MGVGWLFVGCVRLKKRDVGRSGSPAGAETEEGTGTGTVACVEGKCMCDVCQKRPAKPKQKRCGSCLSDIQAARRDAQKSGKAELFNKIFKEGGEALQDFLFEFNKANPDRKPFQNRLAFDWVRYEQATKLAKKLKLGYKAVMMDRVDFIAFKQEKEGLTRQEALDLWDKEAAAAKYCDSDGRQETLPHGL